MDLVLASSSPRRFELLKLLGIPFRVEISEGEGEISEPYEWGVQELAREKACQVSGDIVLAADTIVVKEGQVLGKPVSKEEAKEMLIFLSGGWHQVYTGICVKRQQEILQDVELTKVCFRSLTEREIEAYLEQESVLDKAGAYGIQGLGSLLIEKIAGCYYNVVGLPLVKTMFLLRKCGIKILGEEC
ncbi:MAG TPA: septum formation protein Maf [Clostridia bacterium]|jgi:septum formation protein|nr:septum formation protein Maf [Clostridia bacterium]